MKELSRFEMAVIKRTAQNTKSLRTKRDKLVAKINASQAELDVINATIEEFEAPIKTMTGGFTSEEVLNGAMAVTEATEEVPVGEVADNETVSETEVPAEEAVAINPEVESPLAEE